MKIPLLTSPSQVSDVIQKYASNHGGNNPTRKELSSIFRELGNIQEDIDEYIDIAIKAYLVDYDKATDILSTCDWQKKCCK